MKFIIRRLEMTIDLGNWEVNIEIVIYKSLCQRVLHISHVGGCSFSNIFHP